MKAEGGDATFRIRAHAAFGHFNSAIWQMIQPMNRLR